MLHHLSGFPFRPVLLYRTLLLPSSSFFHTETLISEHVTSNGIVDGFGRLLHHASTLLQSEQIHAQITAHGASPSPFLASTLVSLYASYGLLLTAAKVFKSSISNGATRSSLVSNSMLRAFMSYDKHNDALMVYLKMLETRTRPDAFTFPLVIRACSNTESSHLCRIVHSHAVKMGYQSHLHVCNELMSFFSKQGMMVDALKLFDRMPVKTHVSWNTVLSGFALNRDYDAAMDIFRKMDSGGKLKPNPVTWTSLLSIHARCDRHIEVVELLGHMLRKADAPPTADSLAVVLSSCSLLHFLGTGKTVHGYVTKTGFEQRICVKNSLICMYGRHRLVKDAERAFLDCMQKDVVTWNALISCYAESGLCDEAFAVFSEMENQQHCEDSRPNVVSWSAVIDSFICRGRWEESLGLFRKMQFSSIRPSRVTVLIVLMACVELGAYSGGREVHGHTVKALVGGDCLVVNGLVNMYTKSGRVREAYSVFKNCESKDIVSWNSMITGFGMHGYGLSSLRMLDELIESGMVPDEVTFVAVLSACSHGGMVREGRLVFKKMVEEFRIEPKMEHYSCMVDLLGRAGLLGEAAAMVERMPMDPNVCVWGAFLNSCGKYRNSKAAEKMFREKKGGEVVGGGSYMLMSNIYAASGRWEESAMVRRWAKAKGLKKVVGMSWVEVNNKVHIFSCDKACGESIHVVYATLEGMTSHMEADGAEFGDFLALD